jgi:xylulose-5-phosphate/fructose-6-phosphate phosphoketolase
MGETSPARSLTSRELDLIARSWQAANYLSVGQIYLLGNALLKERLRAEHIKPRLLGHWGTTPGLNFIYVHLNRLIRAHDLNVIYVCGPGHGGPGMVANTYLEGRARPIPTSPSTPTGFRNCSGSFPSRVGFQATPHPRHARQRRSPRIRGTGPLRVQRGTASNDDGEQSRRAGLPGIHWRNR